MKELKKEYCNNCNNDICCCIIKTQETLEEVRKVERTELFNSIYSVVKKIPTKDVDGDAIDAPSCAYELEQLFYKWQQEQDKNKYSKEEVLKILESLVEHPTKPGYKRRDIVKFIEQFKKK